ncbi:hypothetical protein [Longimicrobium sp.]|uniref:hypothetical protein n=1 Tax=Longimicrobium sp. TaxID=2029185 RepID=UPI002E2ECDFA|nr:hypothetical protein [Longimicrobium sp.]HEX6038594.1 hypothetical protein [Longimicrobium sp.]
MRRRCVAAAALAACVVAGPVASASGPARDEPWTYPRGTRDPLVPPASLYAGQDLPRIEVTLIGVDSHHPGKPLAVVRVDSRPPVRRVVRPGDRVGDYRILQIHPRSVRVAVPGFGGTTVLNLSVRDSTPSTP